MGVLDSIEQTAYTLSPLCHIRNMQSKRSIAKQEQRLQSDVNDRTLHGILEDNEREQEQDSSLRSRNGSTSTATGLDSSNASSTSSSDVDVRRDDIMVDNGPQDVTTTASTAADVQSPTKQFEKIRSYHVGSGRAVNWTGGDSPQISATQQDKTSKTSDAKTGGSTSAEPAATAARDDKPQPAANGHEDCQPSNTAETAGNENKRTRIRRYTFEWDSDVSRPSVMSGSVARANTSPRAQKFLAACYARQQQQQEQKQKEQQEQQQEQEREQKTQQEKPQALVRRSRFVESFEHTAAQTIARHNGESTMEPSVVHDDSCFGAQPTSTRRELKAKMESFAAKLSRTVLLSKDERRKKQEQKDKDAFMSRYMGNGKEEYAAEMARLIMEGAGGGRR